MTDHYRSLNDFETGLERYMDRDMLNAIRDIHVGIAGAGGLGSNCAAHLVRCGFRRFTIVDHDHVDPSNLNRQFFFLRQTGHSKVAMLNENLRAINPDLDIRMVEDKIEPHNIRTVFDGCDCIVEALDAPEGKKLVVETYLNSDVLLVAVSGIGGFGNSDAITVKRVKERFYLIGDGVSEVSDRLPPFSPGVTIAAAKQADVILTCVTGGAYGEAHT